MALMYVTINKQQTVAKLHKTDVEPDEGFVKLGSITLPPEDPVDNAYLLILELLYPDKVSEGIPLEILPPEAE